MKLYSYFRSSCSYRLRIALNLKGVDYEYVPVNLLQQEQRDDNYRSMNPMGLVPTMEVAPGEMLGQSIALLEWLEERFPEPPLLPQDPLERVRVRSLVNAIACDVQPLCNIGVTGYLKREFEATGEDIDQWNTQWMHRAFLSVESVLADSNSSYCFGEVPGMADVCLVPQIYNAHRMNVRLNDFPNIERVVKNCSQLEPFRLAAPENQPDSTL